MPDASRDTVAHFGQPIAETRALDEGRAFVDLSHEAILTISGPDRLTWLNSFTSQQLLGMQPGDSAETLILSPQGRIEHVLRVIEDGERLWLLVSPESREPVMQFLTKMRFALRVDLADVSDEFAQVLVFDGPVDATLREIATPVVAWRDPWGEVAPGGHQYADAEPYRWPVSRVVVARADHEALLDAVRAGTLRVAGIHALDALEIEARRVGVQDIDERTIPHELDWLRSAVHLNKGCYRGQETVAKVHNLGHPPRRLVLLHLEGAEGELPAPGTLLHQAGAGEEARPVGRVTRSGMHHDWGALALAMLKRTTPEDAVLEVRLPSGSVCEATQDVIVPSGAGATRRAPRLPRLG